MARNDTIEATTRIEIWRGGRRVPAGTKMQLPRAEYERDRAYWETEEDRRQAAQQQAASEEPRRAEQAAFWARVKALGEAREAQEVAAAKALEEAAEHNRKRAQKAREAAEAR